jgi:hypothetical protein
MRVVVAEADIRITVALTERGVLAVGLTVAVLVMPLTQLPTLVAVVAVVDI